MLTRSFSTSSSKAALVKTPIPVYGIEGRYSAALFSAAQKKKSLDVVEGDLVSYRLSFLAPSGAQGVAISVRPSVLVIRCLEHSIFLSLT